MTTTKSFAPAKVNLSLHVTGQQGDGYHLLDSLVVFADIGDWVQVTDGVGLSLSVSGPMAARVPSDGRNSILQAAAFLRQDDLAFSLDKQLPASAGIGGGTSDAAASLRAVVALRGCAVPADLLPLGADVPICALAQAARMQGIGERVTPVSGLPRLYAVLVNPGVTVATPTIFKALARKDNAPMPDILPRFQTAVDLAGWLRLQRNDLERPAIAAQPIIGGVLGELSATGAPLLVRMSGSGATCFALYASAEEAALSAADLAFKHPDWWVRACQLA